MNAQEKATIISTVQTLALIRAQTRAVTLAYPDPGYGWKVPTICHGHTRGVKKGDTATLEQCEAWLIEDYEAIVLPALVRCVTAPVTENEAAALADFVFNVGGPGFCASTLVKKLNALDYAGAAAQFDRWVYSNGKKLPGLVKRRAAERALFEREAT
ncbi:MAG: lysozyme [Zoogloeaceae bacterium]|nr:lysozyme [Zoogloeaceae bacterium]